CLPWGVHGEEHGIDGCHDSFEDRVAAGRADQGAGCVAHGVAMRGGSVVALERVHSVIAEHVTVAGESDLRVKRGGYRKPAARVEDLGDLPAVADEFGQRIAGGRAMTPAARHNERG